MSFLFHSYSSFFLQLHQKMQWLKCNSPWGSSLVKTLSHISQNRHKIAREKKHHLNSRARVRMVIFCKCCVLVSLPVILVLLCLSGQKRKEKSNTCTLQYPWWRQISVKNLAARWRTVQLFLFSYYSTEAYRWWINCLIFWNLFFWRSTSQLFFLKYIFAPGLTGFLHLVQGGGRCRWQIRNRGNLSNSDNSLGIEAEVMTLQNDQKQVF